MNDGGPAFPETRWDDIGRQEVQWTGMSLRDWFAGIGISSLIADEGYANNRWPSNLAEDAYKIADAMLKARIK